MNLINKLIIALFGSTILIIFSCTYKSPSTSITGKTIQLTILQTADIHSRLYPYTMDVGEVDKRLGLNPANAPFGGAARLAYLVRREREKSDRVLHIDCGDPFQGAPVFNYFEGEVEFTVLSEIGVDALVVGNHEFDRGAENLAEKIDLFANFPVLAANYAFRISSFPGVNDLGRLIKPYVIFNVKGLRVGVIGIGDTSTINTILESGNKYGITPLNVEQTTQFYVNFLKPQVDLIVVATHQGLSRDERLIEKTSEIDVLLGGHLHIVLNPPKVLYDCANGVDALGNSCTPHPVLLSHVGAFCKYLGRINLILKQSSDNPGNWELIAHSFTLFPVDSTVPEDPAVAELLLPYQWEMEKLLNKDRIIAYAPKTVRRFSTINGDSQLGNIVATAMWLRSGIETDIAFTNTTGIRSDLPAGVVTEEDIINIFPFDNTITTMFLTGEELIELFDYASHRTAVRGCQSQIQIAGMRFNLRCGDCPPGGYYDFGCVEMTSDEHGNTKRQIWINGRQVQRFDTYEIATNNYMAQGGSGYTMLRRNTSQQDSGIPQREAVIDYIKTGKPCVEPVECSSDDDCPEDAICGCDGMWRWDESQLSCFPDGGCAEDKRYCVLNKCVHDVAEFYAEREEEEQQEEEADHNKNVCSWRNWAVQECSKIACIGISGGNFCYTDEECRNQNPDCADVMVCCKSPGADEHQRGICTCFENTSAEDMKRCGCAQSCDPIRVTGMEDGRINILTD